MFCLQPLALVSWGWAMTMSYVDEHHAVKFIKDHALHGPEALSDDGVFDNLLIKPANIVTTIDDESVCPNAGEAHM